MDNTGNWQRFHDSSGWVSLGKDRERHHVDIFYCPDVERFERLLDEAEWKGVLTQLPDEKKRQRLAEHEAAIRALQSGRNQETGNE